ncbi:MAG: ATP-binding protein [Paracoccaceae bacterium]
MGDANRILQILNNLVENAIKFTEQGSVTLSCSSAMANGVPGLCFTITDTGIGMTPQQVARVFDEFEQAEGSTTRRFGGTGLGLSITRRLTELMGGTIRMDSEPGRGTTIRVTLPLASAAAPEQERAEPPTPADTIRGLRLLVADDNRTNRMILRTMLTAAGAQVALAENGADACQQFEQAAPDAVLLDISMPVLDGVAALQRIRDFETRNGTAPVPMLAVTANAMQHQIEEYRALGFCGHIAKPFRKDDLIAAVALAVRRA